MFYKTRTYRNEADMVRSLVDVRKKWQSSCAAETRDLPMQANHASCTLHNGSCDCARTAVVPECIFKRGE
jgi:hypothetical protein